MHYGLSTNYMIIEDFEFQTIENVNLFELYEKII